MRKRKWEKKRILKALAINKTDLYHRDLRDFNNIPWFPHGNSSKQLTKPLPH